MDSFKERLVLRMIGSCTCLTKTNDHNYHNESCMYKILSIFLEKYDMYLFNEVLEETKMQRIEDVKDEGYCAYVNGISKSDNPYNNNEEWDYFLAWDEGFMNAAWDD